jgi:hypothetical protein
MLVESVTFRSQVALEVRAVEGGGAPSVSPQPLCSIVASGSKNMQRVDLRELGAHSALAIGLRSAQAPRACNNVLSIPCLDGTGFRGRVKSDS